MEKWNGPVESLEGLMKRAAVDPHFWRNKKVLVTGHTGFKGSWLCLWLAQMGAKVTGVALPAPTKPSLFSIANVEDVLARSIMLDIRAREKLIRTIRKERPQILFHMAAQPLVRDSYKDPVATYETNVTGTINVFEAVRVTSDTRAVVNVTTDKCYENLECRRGYRETDPLGGYDPYSSSKACSEIVTAAYRRSFFHPDEYKRHGVAIASARAGNVIGGGDWARDRLVPDCIRAFKKGEDIVLRHPRAVRPWQHVLEPISGYLMLAEKLFNDGERFSSAWNFGPEHKDIWSVGEIAKVLCSLWGGSSRVKIASGRHVHEADLLMLDISKAKKQLGWVPQLLVRDALRISMDWYRVSVEGADMREFSLQQISDFRKRGKG